MALVKDDALSNVCMNVGMGKAVYFLFLLEELLYGGAHLLPLEFTRTMY